MENKARHPGKSSTPDEVRIANEAARSENVVKEEESLLEKINNVDAQNKNLSRKERRLKIKFFKEEHRKHMRKKPYVNIHEEDEDKNHQQTLDIKHWVVRKASLESLIMKHGGKLS